MDDLTPIKATDHASDLNIALTDEPALASLLARTAVLLETALRLPTTLAGLNESRYNVLDALRRAPDGTSTQAALASTLSQSESNLSTLLDRMQHDNLISRERSTTDRRKTLIRLALAGSDALLHADHERRRTMAKLLRGLDQCLIQTLCESLQVLHDRIVIELNPEQCPNSLESAESQRMSPSRIPTPHFPWSKSFLNSTHLS